MPVLGVRVSHRARYAIVWAPLAAGPHRRCCGGLTRSRWGASSVRIVRAAWGNEPGRARGRGSPGWRDAPRRPGPDEVRVRVALSGVNPGDTKKRGDWFGSRPPFPRVVPHSDGAGVIERVGEDVEPGRVGQRVWVYGAQSYRPFGTAAQLTVVPAEQAVELPAEVSDEVGACLGHPRHHRAPGRVRRRPGDRQRSFSSTACSARVGSLAAQLARWGGARSSQPCGVPATSTQVDPTAPRTSWRWISPTLLGRFVASRPTAWTGSSRSPSQTT